MTKKDVAWLVHGTFARGAGWTTSTGDLATALTAEAECHVERFCWSGRNSHAARVDAARALADRIGVHSDEAIHHVIAHSHGGNVALHAIRILRDRRGPGSVDPPPVRLVSLATPFLLAVERRLPAALLFPATTAGVVATLVAVLGAVRPSLRSWVWVVDVMLAAAFVSQLVLLGLGFARHRLFEPQARAEFVKAMTAPRVSSGDILVIRAAGDEATGFLVVGQFVGWLSVFLIGLARPDLWRRTWQIGAVVALAAMIAGVGAVSDGLVVLLAYAVALVALPSFIVVSVLVLASLTYGWDGPVTSLFAVTSAESTPPGELLVRQRELVIGRSRDLAHSSLYGDPQVIDRIVEYVRAGRTR